MDSPENIRLVEKLFEDQGKGDLDSAIAAFSNNATLEVCQGTIFGGVHAGREAIRRAWESVARVYPTGLQLNEVKMHSDENRVFAEITWTATSCRGDQVEEHEFFVLELEDRHVTSARLFTMGGEAAAVGDLLLSEVPNS